MNVVVRFTFSGITSAAVLGGFAGCSSSSGDDSAVNPDGGNGSDGSPVSDSSSQQDGSGGDSGDGSGPTAQRNGYVVFTQGSTVTLGTFSNSANAVFYILPAGTDSDSDCEGYNTIATPAASSSSCSIKIWTNPIGDDGGDSTDGGPTSFPNTGNITLLSAADSSGVVLTPRVDGSYVSPSSASQWWTPADNTIDVKSSGSSTSIPAFDDTWLIGPGDISAVKLSSTDITTFSVTGPAFDRGTDLAVATRAERRARRSTFNSPPPAAHRRAS